MNITEAMEAYRLPNPSTPEDLEMRFSGMDGKVLTYGDRILVAGYYWNGPGKASYFEACYEFLSDDHSCEGMVGLRAASRAEHIDDGHAIAWAISKSK